jgi:uncharacterized membrane protein
MLAALVFGPVVRWIDDETRWQLFGFSPSGATTVLSALASAMLTFIVFVVSSLLVVVQLASAQLTPRIIAMAFEARHTRHAITMFSFSFTYTAAASGRIADRVPQLPVAVAILSCLLSIAFFFRFTNRIAVNVRPVSILTEVGRKGCGVIEIAYPRVLGEESVERPAKHAPAREPERIVRNSGASGAVLAFDAAAIVALACRGDFVVEMVPQVGDFVARGDVLFRITAGGGHVDDAGLRECVVIGPERTLEQDPRFAFRVIVDIANKALSPAINDPTTAVLAIDQIHRMLLVVGRRSLDEGGVRDAAGRLRLVYGTPAWEDFVCLGISEIRHFGATSIQVTRRLFAMLNHLIQVLPAERAGALEREKRLLHNSVLRNFPDVEDRSRAEVADSQGVGGSEPMGEPSDLEISQPPQG